MEYLIRFIQVHETFRLPELEALGELENVIFEIVSYELDSPFCILKIANDEEAARLVRRSILAKAIYALWGSATNYPTLYEDVKRHQDLWAPWQDNKSFKFSMDSYQGSRPHEDQRRLFESFSFLAFSGPVRMKKPDVEFCLLEDWTFDNHDLGIKEPNKIYLGRFIGEGVRDVIQKYDLKKRRYISTTSMDSELALVTANIAQASRGKLFYDPFVGTGSFPVACSHFGAVSFGSDIDGRSIRGKGERNLLANFKQYGLVSQFGDSFVADLTNTPLRECRWLDGIVCDPPYGVREGLKVLGNRDQSKPKGPVYQGGDAHHLQPGYVPPKRPYSFLAMLDDILDFAALSLVENGRLSFWMPTSNDKDEEISVPEHPCLQVKSVCTQAFNKWSRRLITYRRKTDKEMEGVEVKRERKVGEGVSADELNPFRKRYFEGFVPAEAHAKVGGGGGQGNGKAYGSRMLGEQRAATKEYRMEHELDITGNAQKE